jgi:hypothetical protein
MVGQRVIALFRVSGLRSRDAVFLLEFHASTKARRNREETSDVAA